MILCDYDRINSTGAAPKYLNLGGLILLMAHFTTEFAYNYGDDSSEVLILLVKHREILMSSESFDLTIPGGYSNENEPHQTTLIRTLKSETGINFNFDWEFIAAIVSKDQIIYIYDASKDSEYGNWSLKFSSLNLINIDKVSEYIRCGKYISYNDTTNALDEDLYKLIKPVWIYVVAALQ